jgi:hypothetical protein
VQPIIPDCSTPKINIKYNFCYEETSQKTMKKDWHSSFRLSPHAQAAVAFIIRDPSNHTVEHQSFGLMMGRQGMNDGGGDDDNTMDNPKHIWPSTCTKLHNLSFKVNSQL